MRRAKSVDEYFEQAEQWRSELLRLRKILVATKLEEELKWGGPCYTWRGKNVVGIGAFKSYFGLWFHQGALLADDENVLINAQEGKTRALRQWRMKAAADIRPAVIKRYVEEAIANVDTGQEIRPERRRDTGMPTELANGLKRAKGATAAFRKLTPGRQREYAEYVASAKRDATLARRLDKVVPMILDGIGLNDRYRR